LLNIHIACQFPERRITAYDREVKGWLARKMQACGRDQRQPGFVERLPKPGRGTDTGSPS
jgi:hypothetical protein